MTCGAGRVEDDLAGKDKAPRDKVGEASEGGDIQRMNISQRFSNLGYILVNSQQSSIQMAKDNV